MKKADSVRESGDHKAAIPLYDKLLASATKLPLLDAGNCYLRRGTCFSALNQYDKAITDYFAALKIFEKIKNSGRIAAACNNIAGVYSDTKDHKNSEKYFLRALNLFIEEKDSVRTAFVMNDLATLYFEKKEYEKAIRIHTKALAE
ncbi:MAG TPA: tetratricopeptide repeat protein, partial [Flavisolibacter sp.]|nr:tetratricopeptide repeat protein [Flavisolibacter sp.]